MTDTSSQWSTEAFQVVSDRRSDKVLHYHCQRRDTPGPEGAVTWQEAIALLQHSAEFRTTLTTTLAAAPFDAFFWEMPPITPHSLHEPWEWVTVAAPALAQVDPDPQPFSRYLSSARQTGIATFPNLGGDALLVAPCEQGDINAYTHIAHFLRRAPAAQVQRFWQVLGNAIQQHLIGRGEQPLWVSTSGLGVSWLHVRLDDTPKYYTYEPYRAKN
jgi:hypothetical protein